MNKPHSIRGEVEIFPQQGGWVFVRMPKKYSMMYAKEATKERGLVAITAEIGKSSWKTSLLPMGDGSHFIALPAKVRVKESIMIGSVITVRFMPRKR